MFRKKEEEEIEKTFEAAITIVLILVGICVVVVFAILLITW